MPKAFLLMVLRAETSEPGAGRLYEGLVKVDLLTGGQLPTCCGHMVFLGACLRE